MLIGHLDVVVGVVGQPVALAVAEPVAHPVPVQGHPLARLQGAHEPVPVHPGDGGLLHLGAQVEPRRRRALVEAARALDRFFASGSAFGPRASSLPDDTAAVFDAATLDADAVEVAALAFRHADRLGPSLDALDLTVDEFSAFVALDRNFEALDAARQGRTDGRVSVDDLEHVVARTHQFTHAQVLAAAAVLGQPTLRNRLDTADANLDILDSDVFGSREPGDGVISRSDLAAFVARSRLNHVLADDAAAIDTAAHGGVADGTVSRRALRAWLDVPANAGRPPDVRRAAQHMLDHQLFDRTWWDRNRDELALGSAVVAGGVVIAVTAGAATPLVTMGAGFAAGATAATGTTVAVNHSSANDLGDGAFDNGLAGGFVGMSAAGVPAAPLVNGTAVVGGGGVDILVPDDWEDEIHDAANVSSLVAGLPGLGAQALEIADLRAGAEVGLTGLGHGATVESLHDGDDS
mgnify:CR=1 FL=1